MVELARFLVVFLKFRKSRRRQAKSWEWTVRPVIDSTLAKTSEDDFQEFNLFCYIWIVYSWRRSTVTDGWWKDNTSNGPFSRCATSNNYGYSLNWRWREKVGLQPRRKLGFRTRGETERQDAQHQWRRDNQDHHSAHETQHLTSECARSPLVSFVQSCVVIFTWLHTTSWLKLCACLTSSMHVVSVTLRLWALHSIQLPLLLIILQSPAVPAALLPLPWGQ